VRGVALDTRSLNNQTATLDSVAAQILPGGLSPKSKETLEAEAAKDGNNKAMLVGLVLGSPEFQRK